MRPDHSLTPHRVLFLDILSSGKSSTVGGSDHHGMHVIVLLDQLPNGRHLFNHLAVKAVHMILLARKHRFAGNQLLLGGLALYVFMDAGLRLVMASGGTVASQLLNWMYGSTWLVSETEALSLLGFIVLTCGLLALIVRPLTLLPLGDTSASSLGLPVTKARLLLLLLAAVLTASATVVIGPLSFVGLIAPHVARVLGQQTVGRQLIVAGLVGGLLLALADYLSRIVVFPNQLPAGLLAALVGGVYFLWGLSRHGKA